MEIQLNPLAIILDLSLLLGQKEHREAGIGHDSHT